MTITKILGGIGLAVTVTLGVAACGSTTHRPIAKAVAASTPTKATLPSRSPSTVAKSASSTNCTSQSLAAAFMASKDVAPGTQASTSKYACLGGYAEANMTSPGLDGVTAYFHTDAGTWTVLSVGDMNATAQSTGIPADTFGQLNTKVQGMPDPGTPATPATNSPTTVSPSGTPPASNTSTVTLDGQPLAISVESFDNRPPPTASPNIAGQPGVPLAPDERVRFLTLSITNQGNTAVSVPLGEQNGSQYQAPIDTIIFDSNDTSTPMEQNLNRGAQEVAPGQSIDAYYQFVMNGTSAIATHVQVSADASIGSGSVTLPIQDSVSA